MCVALIGGMDRLKREYLTEAEKIGIRLRIFTKSETGIDKKVKGSDAIMIFTNKISHRAKREVMNIAKVNKIKVVMCHSCGVCSLRDCLLRLTNREIDRKQEVI